MKITDTKIYPITNTKNERLKAFASISFDDCFVVHDIRVISGDKGLFVAFPAKKGRDATYRDICHPINSDFRKEVETAILDAYNDQKDNATVAAETDM